MPSHAIKGYYVIADLIEVRPTPPHHPPAQPHPEPRRAVPHCAVPHCAGLGWTDVTFHLPRQCTCNWLPRRSLTSDVVVIVVVVAVVAALTQFSFALRCVVFWATHLTQLRATTTTTRGVQRRGACRGVGSAAAAALTFITDSDAFVDPLFSAGLQPKYQCPPPSSHSISHLSPLG